MTGPKPLPAVDRFWPKVVVDSETNCWNWTGARQPEGYGRFMIERGRIGLAHRFAYELLVAPIPADMTVDHLCRNTPCVNPDHLELVTREENALRGSANAAKTHCIRGHEFTADNTYSAPSRPHVRICRACKNAANAARSA